MNNDSIEQRIAYLLNLGCYLLPGEIGKKYPMNGLILSCPTVSYNVKDYPDRMALLELFREYPHSNIIKLNGNEFGDVVIDVDIDGGKFPNEALALIELLKDYPTYVTVTPSGGLHYHYKIDPARPLVGRIIDYKDRVDIILDGASPLPPSRAWSNKINAEGDYTERDPIEINPPTLFPYELFPDLIDAPENRKKFNADKKQRIQEQLDKGEITEYRNDTFHHISIKINAAFPNNSELAWHLVKSLYEKYANKKDFPITELEQTFNSALNGRVVAAAKTTVEELNKKKCGIKEDLCFLDSTEILRYEAKPTKWTIPFILPKSGIVAICADAGVGKTWFSLYIGICIVTGRKFLNKYDVEKGPVIYINQEMDFGEIQDRLKELGLTEGVPFYTFKIRDFSLEEHGEQLIELAKEVKPLLIVFDSLSRIHSKNENSSQEMGWVIKFFIKLSDLGAAVLFPHHVTKNETPNYRGSTAIKAAVDLMLFLDRSKDTESSYILKYEKVRIDTSLKPKKLRMAKGEGLITFEEDGDYEKEEVKPIGKTNRNRTTEKDARKFIVHKLMSDKVQGVNQSSKKSILDEAKKDNLTLTQIEDVLQKLVKEGKLVSPGKGFYELVDEGNVAPGI